MNIVAKIKGFLSGDERTNKVSRNVLGLGLLQVVNMLVSFLLVPLVMNFVSPSQYGIWLTISSMVSWLLLLDVGLGTGMKNKLTEALAVDDKTLAKQYVSTTYFTIGIIITVALVVFYVVAPFVNWSVVYNQDESMRTLLMYTTMIVVSFFLIKLVLGLVGTVLTSYLKPAISQLLNTISNVIVIIIIWILSRFIEGNLVLLATILSASSAVVFFIASIILYNGKYKEIAPSIRCYRKELVKSILGLGINFFVINISMIVLFQANNFIIIHKFSNEDVVVYNLAFKLFSIITILFSLISQPFWTAYTDAWAKKDIAWINRTLRKVFLLWLGIMGVGLVLLVLSPFIYKIWIGDKVQIPFLLSVGIFAYVAAKSYGGVYNIFINGVGKVRLQMICLAIIAAIYIPLVFLLIDVFHLGLLSIPIAQVCANFYSLFIARIQYKKIISGKAEGIWNK